MSNDLFADLLKTTGNNKKTLNVSNLSLNQRLNSSNTNSNTSSSLDLDFLDKHSSKPNYITTPLTQSTNDLDDLLGGFNSTSVKPPKSSIRSNAEDSTIGKPTTSLKQSQTVDLLEDFFSSPIPQTPLANDIPVVESDSGVENSKSFSDDETSRDEALAELLDMGFPIDKASEALDSTEGRNNLDGAVSYLMSQAHKQSKRSSSVRSSLPSRQEEEEENREEDIGKLVSDLSSDLMSKANFLLNVGRKKLQEGIEMYKHQQFENNNNQPLWMKNQQKYKANSMRLPGQDEEDEMDPEAMRNLIEKQKERERQLRIEKERERETEKAIEREREREREGEREYQKALYSHPQAPSKKAEPLKNNSKAFSEASTRIPSRASSDNQPTASNQKDTQKSNPESLFSLFSSSQSPPPKSRMDDLRLTKAEDTAIYVSSSRHRISKASKSLSSTPRSQSESRPKSRLIVLPLSLMQEHALTSAREQAQLSFSNGDYPSALTKYFEASQSIPSDHPFQIILNSNLALVYSKLGNPKEQLKVSNAGLENIKSVSSGLSVRDLAGMELEPDKNLRMLWVKLMSKKAESLEFLEKWVDAKEAYENLICEGENSKNIMDGKRRCADAVTPKSTIIKKPLVNRPVILTSKEGKEAVDRIKKDNAKQEELENEKFALRDVVDEQINSWKSGKENNIRALLCSLDQILWSDLGWKPIKLTDLILDKKVKTYYMKAVSKTHPDKIGNDVCTEKKMIANAVFITLNVAWEDFKKDKGM